MDENSLSHTRWKCQYHIVFIPKYRRKVLYGKVKADIREILRTLCRYKKVEIIEGGGMRRSRTPVPEYTTEDNGKPVCRVLEGEVSVDDLRQAPGTGEQV